MRVTFLAAAVAAAFAAAPAAAQKANADATVLINQSAAINGNVTPGDAAGFPVTLSQPGHYRLTSNLVVPDAVKHGIEVVADGVTIDLNGFGIYGKVGCTATQAVASSIVCQPAGSGSVGVSSARAMTAVFGGKIQGFDRGIQVAVGGRIERLQISHTASQAASGQSSHMSGNLVYLSGGGGLGGTGVIRDNVVSMTRAQGISGSIGTLVVENQVSHTDSFGINANISGAAGVAHNVVSNTPYWPINGGVKMSGNTCNGAAC